MSASYRELNAAIDIQARAESVWKVISDVGRTGEWSPECTRVVPLGRLRTGRLMIGLNRRGHVRWATLSRVVRLEPGRVLTWKVVTNGSVWSYTVASTHEGCRLAQTRRTPTGVGAFANWFIARFLGGTAEHDLELESGMAAGLRVIKSLVETPSTR